MESSGLIYLVCHCATHNDAVNYPAYQGQQAHAVLSAVGEEQAQRLSAYFANKQLTAAYTSTLTRAVRTAQIIYAGLDIPLTFCQSLAEADMGEWEGHTEEFIMQGAGQQYDSFLRDPSTYGYPGGENLSEVCRRALTYIGKIASKHPEDRVLVVSHPQTIRAVLAGLQSLPLHRARELDQEPGAINLIRIFRGSMELKTVDWLGGLEETYENEEEDMPCGFISRTVAS
jgi:broad specificity phosphatase PhoE